MSEQLWETWPTIYQRGIDLLREHEPPGGYWGAFSGGKDSICTMQMATEAGVRVDWHYNMTTIDPPEVVRFIRDIHPEVERLRPPGGNFFTQMVRRGFPTRRNRWCCAELKERSVPEGQTLLLGIRAEESPRRAAQWAPVQTHWRTGAPVVLPILYWSADEVWAYIRDRELPYPSLYDEGFSRLGCIGCPMQGEAGRRREFARWPRYEALWQRAFRRIWDRRTGTTQRDGRQWFGDVYFRGWEEMWEWWLSDRGLPARLVPEEDACQMMLPMEVRDE